MKLVIDLIVYAIVLYCSCYQWIQTGDILQLLVFVWVTYRTISMVAKVTEK